MNKISSLEKKTLLMYIYTIFKHSFISFSQFQCLDTHTWWRISHWIYINMHVCIYKKIDKKDMIRIPSNLCWRGFASTLIKYDRILCNTRLAQTQSPLLTHAYHSQHVFWLTWNSPAPEQYIIHFNVSSRRGGDREVESSS